MVINASDFPKLIDNVFNYSFGSTPKQDENDETVMPIIKECREQLKAKDKKSVFDRIKKYGSSQDYINSISVCKNTIETYFMLYEEFVNQYNILKSNKNMYDYNDIERLTIKLFENAEVLNSIKQNYKKIFVDEFQDANAVQEKIIMSLQSGSNLFFVGDLKQAIYGFRQSNSKIFERIVKDFNCDKQNSRSLSLNCNFRTTKPILDFVNSIFDVTMTIQTASLDYKQKSRLDAQGDFKDEKSPCVELDILYKNKLEKDVANKLYNMQDIDIDYDLFDQNAEANFIAERITKLLNEEIYDIKQEKYRKIEYSDIAILFRTRSNQQDFITAFSKANIPVVEDSNTDLEKTYDVEVLINLIRLSVNFKNDYALASVMMSRLFDFDSNQMLKIKNLGNQKYFYDCVLNYPNNDEIKQKILDMLKTIEKFYNTAIFGGINKALINILQTQSYEYKILQEQRGVSRLKNIQDFVESFNSSKFNLCPSEYINLLEENTREQKVVASAGSNNVVTFTTMHSSKGLEWPVVIIPTLDSKFYHQPKSGEIVLNEELGAGVKFYDSQTRQKYPSVFYDAIDNYNKDNDFSEKLRLLYVALTRPKNRLIMVGTTDKLEYKKFVNDREVRFSPDYLSIIINSLNASDITKINAQQKGFCFLNNNNYVCNVVNQWDYIFKQIKVESVAKNVVDSEDVKKLSNYINTGYFNLEATKIAQKNSVSSILKQEDVFASYNSSPEKLLTSEHLVDVQKNELGSLYHKIIEDFDFNVDISNTEIYKVINKIKQSKTFSNNAINAIDVSVVAKNLKLLKDLTAGCSVIKEHTFVMQLPYSEIQNSTISDKVLVQGVCDLIAIGKNSTVLVDYKYSTLSQNALKQKYNKQLYLYTKAINYGLNKSVDKVYILSLKDANLIECNSHK
ncbi:MAG: UvrD-helicase domain-containing protein [Clostridia bacterium]|nr:UvrD-helicase domain-containing protein [Clostridia bacterium]